MDAMHSPNDDDGARNSPSTFLVSSRVYGHGERGRARPTISVLLTSVLLFSALLLGEAQPAGPANQPGGNSANQAPPKSDPFYKRVDFWLALGGGLTVGAAGGWGLSRWYNNKYYDWQPKTDAIPMTTPNATTTTETSGSGLGTFFVWAIPILVIISLLAVGGWYYLKLKNQASKNDDKGGEGKTGSGPRNEEIKSKSGLKTDLSDGVVPASSAINDPGSMSGAGDKTKSGGKVVKSKSGLNTVDSKSSAMSVMSVPSSTMASSIPSSSKGASTRSASTGAQPPSK